MEEMKVSVSENTELIRGELMNGIPSFDEINAWVKK